MNEIKFVRKSFWAHQYEKEEKFLSSMRSHGWRFTSLHRGFLSGKYEFEKCEPEDYIYQLDYINAEDDTASYHQLFKDAEWEEIFSWGGVYNGKWYYYCKRAENGKDERLYTDSESKIILVNKLLRTYGIVYLIIIFSYITQLLSTSRLIAFPVNLFLIIPFTILLVFMGYYEIGMLLLKNKLKEDND